jgi:hypothetical protein
MVAEIEIEKQATENIKDLLIGFWVICFPTKTLRTQEY